MTHRQLNVQTPRSSNALSSSQPEPAPTEAAVTEVFLREHFYLLPESGAISNWKIQLVFLTTDVDKNTLEPPCLMIRRLIKV